MNMKIKKQCVFGMLALALLMAIPGLSNAQTQLVYTNATELTLTGKIGATAEVYHRVNVDDYPELNNTERTLLTYPTGVAVAFTTNSATVGVKAAYKVRNIRPNWPEMATAGFDLFIKQDGEWIYAACGVPPKEEGKPVVLINNMDGTVKECLLYLPMYSELESVEIGVAEGAEIAPMADPFRGRILFFGSSYTHGASTSRAGNSFPSQIGQMTGLGVINIGVSGNSKLQPAFADILGDSDADAFVIDAFSNPSAEMIGERFAAFVARLRAAQPGKPIIFLQTIYRERGNFDLKSREYEENKREMARKVVAEAMKSDPDIYFVDVPHPTGTDHLTSADGTHPSDLGYYRWARAIQPEITKILSRYGIK